MVLVAGVRRRLVVWGVYRSEVVREGIVLCDEDSCRSRLIRLELAEGILVCVVCGVYRLVD